MGEGECGMIRENGIETCILSYKKRSASPGLMQDTGSLGLVHWVMQRADSLGKSLVLGKIEEKREGSCRG